MKVEVNFVPTWSLSGLATVLFVAMKLTGCIDWSWWWVLSPVLVAIGVWATMIFLFFTVSLKD